jgi:NAD+ diphosphatase
LDIKAFFFQSNSLLLPANILVSIKNLEISMLHAGNFPSSDIFSIPAISGNGDISCVLVSSEIPLPPNFQAVPVRQVLSLLSVNMINDNVQICRLLRAFHIAQWRQESRFCANCGAGNKKHTVLYDAGETAHHCQVCGHIEFPRIAPSVITIITNDDDNILLAHNKKFTPCMYSLIAGFVEAGESLEAAVARETREEAGIEICDIQYRVSQSWPFPNSLMAGFSARYASGTLRPDGIEIEDAQWFSRDNLPLLPGHGSVSRYLIDQGLNKR